jgi:hypothetical protein
MAEMFMEKMHAFASNIIIILAKYKYNANTNNCIANQGALSSCIINCND